MRHRSLNAITLAEQLRSGYSYITNGNRLRSTALHAFDFRLWWNLLRLLLLMTIGGT